MSKFKVGDKVVRVSSGGGLEEEILVGHCYTVLNVHGEFINVLARHGHGWLLGTRFKLYEEKEKEMALTSTMTAEQIRNEILRIRVRIEEAKKDIENAEKERDSLVEKLREKGFELTEDVVEVKSTKDIQTLEEVVIGRTYVVTNNFGKAEPYIVGRTVVVKDIDYNAHDLFIFAVTEDGEDDDWMHYKDLSEI